MSICALAISARMEGLEASTVRQYRQHLEHHIEPMIGYRARERLKRETDAAKERERENAARANRTAVTDG